MWLIGLVGLLVVVIGCSKGSSIECGEGTELKANKCVVSAPIVAPPIVATGAPVTVSPLPVVTLDAAPAGRAPASSGSAWEYRSTKDEMRGTTTSFASIVSENSVHLPSPYGEVKMILTLRKNPGSVDVFFHVAPSGQFMCSYDGCNVAARLDGGKVQNFYSREGESTGTLFVSKVGPFITQLKSASTAIFEMNFYQAGDRQFTFNVASLTWPPKLPA